MQIASEYGSPNASRPVATIILRAFNQEDFVGDAVRSCFDQTYTPLEIILSDDCSSDGTWQVIKSMAESYTGRHRVVTNRNPENLGIVGHTNKTMQMATGKLILSCAGDDIAAPEKTDRLVKEWAKRPDTTKAVSSGYMSMSLEGVDLGPVSALRSRSRKPEPGALEVIRNRAWCVGAATMWHRDVIDVFGQIPSVARAEDNSLLLRAALLGEVRYVDESLLRKRVGGVSNPTGKPIIDAYFSRARTTCQNRIATVDAFLFDIALADPRLKRALTKACHRRRGPLEFERELGGLERSARLARLPAAVFKAFSRFDSGYLGAALKYSFPDTYIAYRSRRYESRE